MYARAPGRPKCEYGCRCYQANPAHWTHFDHPAEHERLAGLKRKQPEEQREVIDLETYEPVDCPGVIALIDMGYAPGVVREAFALSHGSADPLATAAQYCEDRTVAEGLAARLARSDQARRTDGDMAFAAALASEMASEMPSEHTAETDAAMARRLHEEEQARSHYYPRGWLPHPLHASTPTRQARCVAHTTRMHMWQACCNAPHRNAPHRTAPQRNAAARRRHRQACRVTAGPGYTCGRTGRRRGASLP